MACEHEPENAQLRTSNVVSLCYQLDLDLDLTWALLFGTDKLQMNKLELMYLSCPLLLNAQQEMSALIFWYEVQYVWVRISREGKITFLLLNGKLWPSKATPQHLSVG